MRSHDIYFTDLLRGVLPLGEVKHLLFGHSLISVPFCVYGGVLADDDTVREALELRAMHLGEGLIGARRRMRILHPVELLARQLRDRDSAA